VAKKNLKYSQFIVTDADKDNLRILSKHLGETIPGFKITMSATSRWALAFAVRTLNLKDK
jgi:hypothetical protein